MRGHARLAVALAAGALTMGCEGDLNLRMVQRDLNSTKSEVAAVARTAEGTRVFLEERLKKLEGRLEKSERARAAVEERLGKVDQEHKAGVQGFRESQASVAAKLDELTTEARLAQGRTEEVGHGITEMNRRIDDLGHQVDQLGRRVNGFDKQISQALGAAQEATAVAQQGVTASQQTAAQVTAALQQMAQQTNAAIEQVNATAQLALAEARKGVKPKQAPGPAGSPPAVAPIKAPALVAPAPAVPTPAQGVGAAAPAARAAPSPPPPLPDSRPVASVQGAGELYRNALNDYTRGSYELAINGFQSYIERYPDGSLLPSARYWLGEAYYSQKNYDQAIKEFALLVKAHPDDPKAAAAMLKQGFAYLELGDTSRARTALNGLLQRFPKSQEARWAKERLSRIK